MPPPDTKIGHENLTARGVSKMKYFSVLLLLFFGFLFFGCDEAELMVEPVISSVETGEAQSDVTAISRYTGVLYRVSDVERFGSRANDPVALEWNGTDLYMIAEEGYYPNKGEYLFRVDREMGTSKEGQWRGT